MKKHEKKTYLRPIVAVCCAAVMIVGGSFAANAVTGGKLFQNVKIWINGQASDNGQVTDNGDGTLTVNAKDADGTDTQYVLEMDGGFDAMVDSDTEMDVVIDSLDVDVTEEDGAVYLIVGTGDDAEKIDITDQLDKNGAGTVEYDGLRLAVEKQPDGSFSVIPADAPAETTATAQ